MSFFGDTSRNKTMAARSIKVLIVDDSAVVRAMLARELSRDPRISVVGAAPDPYVARDMIVELSPDVLTLDVEMPRMDGITFLRRLMASHPLPVIVLSSLTGQGTQTAIDAMAAGAVDVVCKGDSSFCLADMGRVLIEKVKLAAVSSVHVIAERSASQSQGQPVGPRKSASFTQAATSLSVTTQRIIAIGASTGGVQALTEVLTRLPPSSPPVLIVQHMPAKFTASFAQRLDAMCQVHVHEATHGDIVAPGRVLIAPGDQHMTLRRSGASYIAQLNDGPQVHHQRPSVDVLFDSVARVAGANAVGAILTGMGADGAGGLLRMRQAGARTIAQDEATCIVFGMPAEAIKLQAAEYILPLTDIAAAALRLARLTPTLVPTTNPNAQVA